MLTAGVWAGVAGLMAVFIAGMIAGLVLGPAATSTVLLGWDPAVVDQILASWGLPAGAAVAYVLLLEMATCALGVVATWVLLQRPLSAFRAYVALVLLLHVTVGGSAPLLLAAAVPALGWMPALTGLGWFGLFSLLLVFPDGRFVPGWTRWTVLAWAAVFVWFLSIDPGSAPPIGPFVALVTLLLLGVIAQIHRYRHHSDLTARRQTRSVLVMLGIRAGLVAVGGLVRLFPGVGPTPAALVIELTGLGLSYLISALLALSIALAVVRHRLFDTDVVVARAVVYASVTGFVLIVYGVVVGLVGLLWPSGGIVLPVLATAAAAVALVPVRSWLQRRAARLVYGERAEPYRVIGQLGDRLAGSAQPEDLVSAVVATVGPALDLSRATILLGADTLPVATFDGDPDPRATAVMESFAIVHRGRAVGRLDVTPRQCSPLTDEDRVLLQRVADQAGLAVAAAQASAELRIARDRAVSIRDEERRRLHRDLHDGLGPTLASLYQRVDLARQLVDTDPETSRRLLDDSSHQIRETVVEIRRLVHALRPPQLAVLGLVDAVRTTCDQLSSSRPVIELHCPTPLPQLPDTLEITAYRIVQEAITNVVRHADADRCTVDLNVQDGFLVITVHDDGRGLPSEITYGAGIESLRERTAKLGGTFTVGSVAPCGTHVTATLPLRNSHE